MYLDTLELKVDKASCVGCGLCAADCKNHCIIMDADGFPCVNPDGGAARCMHCRHCLMICPAGALSVDGVQPSDCAPKKAYPEYRQLLNLVKNRRSYRNYWQKNVDPTVVAELMDAMKYVPTGVNRRGLYFGLIDDIETMNAYRRACYERFDRLFDDPAAAPEAYRGVYQLHQAGEDPVFRTAPHLIVAFVAEDSPCADADPLIALSYFELLAQAKGLGTCWFGRIMFMQRDIMPDLFRCFHAPAGYKAGYAMLFGEPASAYCRDAHPDAVNIGRPCASDIRM